MLHLDQHLHQFWGESCVFESSLPNASRVFVKSCVLQPSLEQRLSPTQVVDGDVAVADVNHAPAVGGVESQCVGVELNGTVCLSISLRQLSRKNEMVSGRHRSLLRCRRVCNHVRRVHGVCFRRIEILRFPQTKTR